MKTKHLSTLLIDTRKTMRREGRKRTWKGLVGIRTMAKRAHVAYTTIASWERGVRPLPVYLPSIARAYGLALTQVKAAHENDIREDIRARLMVIADLAEKITGNAIAKEVRAKLK